MADNIVVIPILCPIKFVRQGYSLPAPYNTKYFEDWTYGDTIRNFEQEVGHLQPWQNNDIIELALLSNYSPFSIILQNCKGVTVDTFTMDREVSSTDISGLLFYRASIALDGYPQGVYRLVMDAGGGFETFVSEWFQVKELHENSFLLQYKHSKNDYDAVFENGLEFRLRCMGGLSGYTPKTDRVVFIDQTRSAVQVDAKNYATERLYFNDEYGIPNWFIERINAVFMCDTVLVDGAQYVANENAQVEATREENRPLVGWSLEVRRAKSTQSKRFVKAAEGAGEPTTTLVYNIESRGFGSATSGGASDNTVQIIATE